MPPVIDPSKKTKGSGQKSGSKPAPAKTTTTSSQGTGGWTAARFARELLARLGAPATSSNIRALVSWMAAEGGNWENTARYNPLNTTQSMAGDAGSMNSVGVRVFTSWKQGLDATVKTLENGNYGNILSALKGGADPGAVLNAVVASPWSTYSHGITLVGSAHSYGTGSAGSGGGGTSGTGGGVVYNGTGSGNGPGESNVNLDLKQLEKRYGAIATLLNDTQLAHIVKKAVAQGWDDSTFTAHLYNTDFYKKHSDAQKNWLLLSNGPDQGEAKAEIHKQAGTIASLAASMGVDLSHDEILQLSQLSLLNGFNDQQLQKAIAHHFEWQKNQHAAGQAGVFQDQYQQLASQYGVPVSKQLLGKWVQQSLTGHMTPDTVKAYLEQQALSLYPGLSQQFKQGMSVADVAGPYQATMANLLGLNPEAVTMSDPLVKRALQYSPDAGQPPTLMPLWQFEQQVRSDPRWLSTPDAHQSLMGTGVQILKDWGITA